MMNLVMFGYFSSSQYFSEMTDISIKDMIFKNKMKEIDDDMIPFGFIDDGTEHMNKIERDDENSPWAIEYDTNF